MCVHLAVLPDTSVAWALWEEMSQCWVDTLSAGRCPSWENRKAEKEGHVIDGKGHLSDRARVSVGEEASFACLSPKSQALGYLAQDPGSASGSQG